MNPVNDVPTFALPSPPNNNDTVPEDFGPRTIGWATQIKARPGNESDGSCAGPNPVVCQQTLTFAVTNDNNDLFLVQPAIDPLTGTLTYTPALNENGVAIVSVTLIDSGGTALQGDDTSETRTFTITVTEVNDPPTAVDDNNSTPEDAALVFSAADLVGNDSKGPANEAGQTLTVIAVGNATNGTVGLNAGQVTFTPNADYNGPASFEYTVQDNGTTNGVHCGTFGCRRRERYGHGSQ